MVHQTKILYKEKKKKKKEHQTGKDRTVYRDQLNEFRAHETIC